MDEQENTQAGINMAYPGPVKIPDHIEKAFQWERLRYVYSVESSQIREYLTANAGGFRLHAVGLMFVREKEKAVECCIDERNRVDNRDGRGIFKS